MNTAYIQIDIMNLYKTRFYYIVQNLGNKHPLYKFGNWLITVISVGIKDMNTKLCNKYILYVLTYMHSVIL